MSEQGSYGEAWRGMDALWIGVGRGPYTPTMPGAGSSTLTQLPSRPKVGGY